MGLERRDGLGECVEGGGWSGAKDEVKVEVSATFATSIRRQSRAEQSEGRAVLG